MGCQLVSQVNFTLKKPNLEKKGFNLFRYLVIPNSFAPGMSGYRGLSPVEEKGKLLDSCL